MVIETLLKSGATSKDGDTLFSLKMADDDQSAKRNTAMRISITRSLATIAAVALLTLAGCSSQPELTPAQQKAGDYAELNFDLDKCLPVGSGLYRCPAIDKPICTTEFSRPDIECVRVGKKGNVFVQPLPFPPL